MKQILAAVVLLVYFTVSTGFVICLHYCMDKVDSVELSVANDETCHKCGMRQGSVNCCRVEVMVVKLKTTHLASETIQSATSVPVAQLENNLFLLTPFQQVITEHATAYHGPPLSEQDVHLRNCVFRC